MRSVSGLAGSVADGGIDSTTLAMEFGIVHILSIDIQQVSIATLILSLGLLADMPAVHDGPLREPLCYAQIGGLAIATFITLLLVPVLYNWT